MRFAPDRSETRPTPLWARLKGDKTGSMTRLDRAEPDTTTGRSMRGRLATFVHITVTHCLSQSSISRTTGPGETYVATTIAQRIFNTARGDRSLR